MCGRVIQSSGPLRYAIFDGMNVRDSRVHNYPPRWNGAPSQDLLVIRRNHQTGQVSLDPLRWGLIPYRCEDPKGGRKPINAKCETVVDLPTFRDAYLWSPKRSANGARNPSISSMREVAPGDLVFSFADTKLPALGVAQSYCWESSKAP